MSQYKAIRMPHTPPYYEDLWMDGRLHMVWTGGLMCTQEAIDVQRLHTALRHCPHCRVGYPQSVSRGLWYFRPIQYLPKRRSTR